MRVAPLVTLLAACVRDPGLGDTTTDDTVETPDPDTVTTPVDTPPGESGLDTDDPEETVDTVETPPVDTPTVDTWPALPDASSMQPGELVIVELMINPRCADDDGEYLELIWLGAAPVDLKDLVLADAQGAEYLDHHIVQPGERVVLWRTPRAGNAQCLGLQDGLAYSSFFALSNSADAVTLKRPDGVILDSVDYSGWVVPEGASLELTPGRERVEERSDPRYWCPATATIAGTDDLGTPGTDAGAAVGPCDPVAPDTDVPDTDAPDPADTDAPPPIGPGELVINGVLANPETPCDDNDGEWFTFVNVADRDIDLRGMVIHDDGGARWTVPTSVVIGPGEELIAWHDRGAPQCHGFTGGVPFGRASLSNTNGDVITLESYGVVIDALAYTDAQAASGIGWELDPAWLSADANDDPSNWCAATTPFSTTPDLGTPGTPNASCAPPVDTDVVDTDTVDTTPVDTDTVDTDLIDTDQPVLGVLLLSEVASTPTTAARYVEVWNPGPDPVDLTGWAVQIYYNGSTSADTRALTSAILAPGDTWVVAYSANGFQTAWSFPADQAWGSISSNGDDVYALAYDRGTGWEVIDVFGEVGVDGTGTAWEFADLSGERNAGVTAPSAVFDLSSWTLSTTFTPGVHPSAIP